MTVVRNEKDKKIEIFDETGVKLLELGFYMDEFTITLYTRKPVVISEEDDFFFYQNFLQVMNSRYIFSNEFSQKTDQEIIWFSDQYCDFDNKEETDRVNRLLIQKLDHKISVSFFNPYFEKVGITRSYGMVSFSPAGNGYFSRNLSTGSTFQDDIVTMFFHILNKEDLSKEVKIIEKSKIKEKKSDV